MSSFNRVLVRFRDELEQPATRAKVEALLKAESEAGDFMKSVAPISEENTMVNGSVDPGAVSNVNEQPGAEIDRYKLLEQIGEGGFGTV